MSINLGGEGQSTLLSFVSVGVLDEAAQANAPRLMKLLELNDVCTASGSGSLMISGAFKEPASPSKILPSALMPTSEDCQPLL